MVVSRCAFRAFKTSNLQSANNSAPKRKENMHDVWQQQDKNIYSVQQQLRNAADEILSSGTSRRPVCVLECIVKSNVSSSYDKNIYNIRAACAKPTQASAPGHGGVEGSLKSK